MSKKSIVFSAGCVVLVLLSLVLLGSDHVPFLFWWIAVGLIGLAFYPVVSRLFSSFRDKGWAFSKALGLAVSGYLMFALCRGGVLPFTGAFSLLCVVLCAAVCLLLYRFVIRKKDLLSDGPAASLDLILLEELLFLGIFLMWTYFTGFNPKALSTEKFMDYGFMAAMMRDTQLPAVDMWHASDPMNYYYGGQYYAVFLTKLTATRVNETYNIAKALIAAFTFVLPFSIAWNLFDRREEEKPNALPVVSGILSGVAVSLAGNVHYVLYGLFGGVLKLPGTETYWFPSSTRYIGHNPSTADECIHEFPSYSFVLGDLHAHVVNLIFVLLLIGLLLAWFRWKEKDRIPAAAPASLTAAQLIKGVLADPYLWLFAFLIGIYEWTNYWDFAIYLVVCLIAFGLYAIRQNVYSRLEAALQFMFRVLIVLVVQFLSAAPFLAGFQTMQSGIGLAAYHSALYQLAVLWGLPTICVVLLLVFVIRYTARREIEPEYLSKKGWIKRFISGMTLPDMFALLLGICAIGLIIAPEIIYVKDIYGGGLSRANTMFKFTYQAYLMFGISMIYALMRLLTGFRKGILRVIPFVLLFIFLLTCGYFPYAVKCWFGDVFDKERYQGLNANAFLATELPGDASAIYWMQNHIIELPVVLQANGNSYSTRCAPSAMTGLPTVMGWYTHEWLWRGDTSELNRRNEDIRNIYTSSDRELVQYLIQKYDIEYIFVGSAEREEYSNLNEEMLQSLGHIVYRVDESEIPDYSDAVPAYIIQINRN